ncbi:hypothetical protein GCM10010503_25080 [Streptomyces lucensis JCM 4490]|uniref:Uncharacterized protein n=1 Tax=Streptomyces lucensis JCM 4490 TaxID=1306176 RepID=A0A918MRG9_9ACTN|nr:hypothetical protein GCM10010503_25080 [Streptomyces lucensis JCM 4490]
MAVGSLSTPRAGHPWRSPPYGPRSVASRGRVERRHLWASEKYIREPLSLVPGRTVRCPAASREPESLSRLLSSQTDRRCHFSTRWAQAG